MPKTTKFLLVNPILIGGNSEISFVTKNVEEAAQNAWETVTKKILNFLPKSYFSLMDEDKNLFHFTVKEKIDRNQNGGGETSLNYSISQHELELPKNIHKLFIEKVDNILDQRNTIHNLDDLDDSKPSDVKSDGSDGSEDDTDELYGGDRDDKRDEKKKKKDDSDSSDSDDEENDKYLVKLYKKWKQERYLKYIEPSVFYWWYFPTIYRVSTIYTPVADTVLYYNDVTPVWKSVQLTA